MNVSSLHLRPLTTEDYQELRATTNWEQISNEQAGLALRNDLFSICVELDNRPVGMGRVVGDGALYFYVQDVVVHPDFQGKGIGRAVMGEIENYLQFKVRDYAFIGLMAADKVASFYQQFGYKARPDTAPGMFKIIQND
nr:GNAT family N-acetyltransferase [Allomuricauda sp.]